VKTIYQTLQNRGNYKEVEKDGPFPCLHNRAWLGPGYYFWEKWQSNAHWWGEQIYGENYIICEAECTITNDNCYDLVGNTDHLDEFENIYNAMVDNGRYGHDIKVADVIDILRNQMKSFNYEAIKSPSHGARRYNNQYSFNIKFKYDSQVKDNMSNKQRLEVRPLIQICIFKKSGLGLRDFHIIYIPE